MPNMKRRPARLSAPPAMRPSAKQSDFDRVLAAQREDHAELTRIGRALDIQFQRIAQIQVDLDEIKNAWVKLKSAP